MGFRREREREREKERERDFVTSMGESLSSDGHMINL